MSRSLTSALLAVLLVTGCGSGTGSSGPATSAGDASPQAAWTEDGVVHVVQGDLEREVDGQWQPWLWLPNGDLVMHTPPDSSGMAVYRPSSDELVVETDDEWGRDKYDGGEYGLDSETGAITAQDALLRIVDGDQPDDLDQGPLHYLVDYDERLEEQARVELPGPDDPAVLRDYDFPVRVGATTFIAFEETAIGGDLTDADNVSGGILRLAAGESTVVVRAPFVQRVFLSSDGAAALAVTSSAAPEMGDVVADGAGKRIVELDPLTGEVGRDLGAPGAYRDLTWQVQRVDRVGGRVAVEIATECADAPGCVPRRTWTTDGTSWSEIAGQAGRSWFWQAGGTAVSISPRGRISWTNGSDERRLAGTKASDAVASGMLIPPS